MSSELRGELLELREIVVEHFGFADSGRLVFYIDELLKSNPDPDFLRSAIDEIGAMVNTAKAPEAVCRKIEDLKSRSDAV